MVNGPMFEKSVRCGDVGHMWRKCFVFPGCLDMATLLEPRAYAKAFTRMLWMGVGGGTGS